MTDPSAVPGYEHDEPLTGLDTHLDDLVRALGRFPNLPGLIAVLTAYDAVLGGLTPSDPAVVDAVAAADVWRALADVATDVSTLRNMKENS
ncbi:hypothetical protein [Nocardioides sp.]|uniref:hypothetical protein n=1 Tax=Nocardioides sp. TaxID=35761 RepID=UPI002C908E69|nr:hypothetical protein [Nocardioides sp.]HXH79110.1 hypothetical protein [Nocardioides sp.]